MDNRVLRKVGIIGCGHISTAHLKSWKKAKHSEVIAVFDINRSLAEEKARKFNIPSVYTDLAEVIEACDVLDVCTPPQTHYAICKQIIEAGRDLIVEKPLVTDVTQWLELKKLVEEKDVKMAVLHNLKFNLSVQKAKDMIDQGKIGRLLRINRYFLTHPDHDRMLVGNTHWSHKLPGGRWYETMPHELYLTHYFAGWSELNNVTVLHTENALPGAPADEVCFTLSNDRVISNYHYSSNCKLNKRFIEFIGTEGVIIVDILSDMVFLDDVRESKRKRGIGIMFLEAASRIVQSVPDRIEYFNERRKGVSPHTRIILQFDRYLAGEDESPTPLEEIDFVVQYCDQVGKQIDEKLKQYTTLV
jgi:predicted dehydrogenase